MGDQQKNHAPATSRDEQKRRLIQNEAGEEDYLDFQNRCVHKFGPAAGIFLRQLLFWVGKQHDPEGWIYKSQPEMKQETGLARRQQEKARKILCKLGVLKEDKRGVPCRLWYWIDLEALLRIMESPHSTMNQWKRNEDNRDLAKTSDEGDVSSRDIITEHTGETDTRVRTSEDDNGIPTCEEVIVEPTGEDRTSVLAITESTSRTTSRTPTLVNEPSVGKIVSETNDPRARGEGDVDRGKVETCVRVLAQIEDIKADKHALGRFVASMIRQFPSVDAVSVCGRYREHVDSSFEPIRSPQALLTQFFKKAAEDGKSHFKSSVEPLHLHSREGEHAKEKPYSYRWFASLYSIKEDEYHRMVEAEMTHAEMLEALEGGPQQTQIA